MVCFVSASETHNQANLNATIAGSLANVAEIAGIVRGNTALRGAVACAFGCPFEGEVSVGPFSLLGGASVVLKRSKPAFVQGDFDLTARVVFGIDPGLFQQLGTKRGVHREAAQME